MNLEPGRDGTFNFESRKLTGNITMYDTNGLPDLESMTEKKLAIKLGPALEGRQLIGKPLGTATLSVSDHGRIDCFLLVCKIPFSNMQGEVRRCSSQQQSS